MRQRRGNRGGRRELGVRKLGRGNVLAVGAEECHANVARRERFGRALRVLRRSRDSVHSSSIPAMMIDAAGMIKWTFLYHPVEPDARCAQGGHDPPRTWMNWRRCWDDAGDIEVTRWRRLSMTLQVSDVESRSSRTTRWNQVRKALLSVCGPQMRFILPSNHPAIRRPQTVARVARSAPPASDRAEPISSKRHRIST